MVYVGVVELHPVFFIAPGAVVAVAKAVHGRERHAGRRPRILRRQQRFELVIVGAVDGADRPLWVVGAHQHVAFGVLPPLLLLLRSSAPVDSGEDVVALDHRAALDQPQIAFLSQHAVEVLQPRPHGFIPLREPCQWRQRCRSVEHLIGLLQGHCGLRHVPLNLHHGHCILWPQRRASCHCHQRRRPKQHHCAMMWHLAEVYGLGMSNTEV
mmetsp:Transcript_21616/g.50648  ORF Transcript_21616/g.50648 Transcript_21616/m.50648 type:complete len:211 (+) Transcript_21616:521-1153(+)